MKCFDCKQESTRNPGPCPKHPEDEFLGYLQGESMAWRRAGQHSYSVKLSRTGDVVRDAARLLVKYLV